MQALRDQIDRIFRSRDFDPPRFGPARWLPDGKAYAIVERSSESAGGSEIARYDAATGSRTVLVSASRLVPSGMKSRADDRRLRMVAGRNRLLIFTNTQTSVAAEHARRLLGARGASGRLKKLGGDAPEASLMFAKFAPDSSRVGVCSREQRLRRAPRRRPEHATHRRRIGDDDQRHGRLGVRRRARPPRRFPLEP